MGVRNMIVIFLMFGVIIFSPGCGKKEEAKDNKGEDVIVLCGGSMRDVFEKLIRMYKHESDDNVMGSYGGSGDLCIQIQNTGRGDIYVCHDPFMPWAEKKGLISEWTAVGYLDLSIIVPKSNPKNIKRLKDLTQKGLRLGIGNQTYSTSGVLVKEMLARVDYGKDILKNVRVETKGHQQRCTDVTLGALDAGLVWHPVALLFKDKLEIIPIPSEHVHSVTSATYGESDLKNVQVTVGIIKTAAERKAVKNFYNFILKNKDVFKEHGFRTESR